MSAVIYGVQYEEALGLHYSKLSSARKPSAPVNKKMYSSVSDRY